MVPVRPSSAPLHKMVSPRRPHEAPRYAGKPELLCTSQATLDKFARQAELDRMHLTQLAIVKAKRLAAYNPWEVIEHLGAGKVASVTEALDKKPARAVVRQAPVLAQAYRERLQARALPPSTALSPRKPLRREYHGDDADALFERMYPDRDDGEPVALREPQLERDKSVKLVRSVNNPSQALGYPYGLWGPEASSDPLPKSTEPATAPPRAVLGPSTTDTPPDTTGSAASVAGSDARLTTASALFDALRPPAEGRVTPTRLLRLTWLLERARELRAARQKPGCVRGTKYFKYVHEQLSVPRRQDLPEEAFISPSELSALTPRGFVKDHRIAVFAISHTWRTADHADPEGETLIMFAEAVEALQARRHVVGTAAPSRYGGLDQFPNEAGVFWE